MNSLEMVLIPVGTLLVLFMVLSVALSRHNVPSIILRQFWSSRTPQKGFYLILAGRPRGLLSWMRSIVGLHRDVRFEVSTQGVRLTVNSISGLLVDFVAIDHVGSHRCGFSRQPLYILIAILTLLAGVGAFFYGQMNRQRDGAELIIGGVSILIALILFLAYFLSKRMEIAVETGGGRMVGVQFAPGVVEGSMYISKEEIWEVSNILQSLTGPSVAHRSTGS